MGWLGRLLSNAAGDRQPPQSYEGPLRALDTLTLNIPFESTAESAIIETQHRKIADELSLALRKAGRLVHNETKDNWFTIIFEGQYAEALWEAAMPVVERHPLPRGSHAIKRWCLSQAQERIRIDWDG